MPDDIKKNRGAESGTVGSATRRTATRNMTILQKRIPPRTVIRSRTRSRSSRTKADSAELPKLSSGPGPDWRDLYFMRN